MRLSLVLVACVTPMLASPLRAQQDTDLQKALSAFKQEDYAKARELAEAAAKADPKNPNAPMIAGLASLQLKDYPAAIASFTTALKLDPKWTDALDRRGDAYLKFGQFDSAIADYDAMLELKPAFKPEHWRRGIALYYAKKYEDGVKQFEVHKLANPEDVENAVWHYLCNVKVVGRDKARTQLIAVTKDARVPMAEIQKLFAGQLQPADVLARAEKLDVATEAGREARFYAHLYVALWYEAEGNMKKVLEHLRPAVEKYKIGHYMWDVAAVHLEMLKK